ncbi:MAG: hypothetical protein JRJ59_01500 [Deltaproteobacteria bacterium]|nr:hypothetical protein [Deltaproteobacteria bacterium]
MNDIQQQVLTQYLAVIRGEKSLEEASRPALARTRPRQEVDARPPEVRQPLKGRYIDLVI